MQIPAGLEGLISTADRRVIAQWQRLQSKNLEWIAEPTSDPETHTVQVLVENLDLHGRAHLEWVDTEERLIYYKNHLRSVGAALMKRLEKQPPPYRALISPLLFQIETLFEARYCHWAAEALEQVDRLSMTRSSQSSHADVVRPTATSPGLARPEIWRANTCS